MFGIGESFPTLCDACASLAKVLRCRCVQAQLGRICSLAWLPAWPADDRGLLGMERKWTELKEERTRPAPKERETQYDSHDINQERSNGIFHVNWNCNVVKSVRL